MKILIFAIALLGILSCNDNQPGTTVEDGDILESNFVDTCDCNILHIDSLGSYIDQNTAYTGVCIGYYPNSKDKYVEKNLLKGRLHGSVTYFGRDGEVLIEETYENGEPKRSGSADYIVCNCDELTQKKPENPGYPVKFSLDDIPFTGTCESFYGESEQIYMEANYLDGFLNGRSTFYNQEGEKLYSEVYESGILTRTIH